MAATFPSSPGLVNAGFGQGEIKGVWNLCVIVKKETKRSMGAQGGLSSGGLSQ